MLRKEHLTDDWKHKLELLNIKRRQLTAVGKYEFELFSKQKKGKLLTWRTFQHAIIQNIPIDGHKI